MNSLLITYNILKNDSAVNTATSGRISPLRLSQATSFPAISYFQVSLVTKQTQTGYSKTDFARVQINIFAMTIAACTSLASQVRSAMQSAPGVFNGIICHDIKFDQEVLLSDDTAGEEGIYHIAQDYILNFNTESIATQYKILLENGDFMLLETGDKILG